MAVSQTLTVTEVANSQSAANNTSKVRILWQSTQSGASYNANSRTAKYYVSVNGGTEKEYAVSYTLPKGTTKTIVDVTLVVTHNSEGAGTVKVRTWMDTKISAGVVEKASTLTLSTIPRASTIDSLSCATTYFTGAMTYKYTPKSASFYNRCSISLNINNVFTAVKTINLGQKAVSQQTATVTLSETELSIVYDKLPNNTKGTLRFTFRTYSDSAYTKQIDDARYKEVTLNIPDNSTTKPTVTMTLTPVSSLDSPFDSIYLQGKSKVKATISATGKNKATIKSYSMSVGNNSYDSNDAYKTDFLTVSGTFTVTGYAKDSRGFTGSASQDITVIPYAKPRVVPVLGQSEVIAARCDKNGNFTDSGTYLKIMAKRSYSTVTIDGQRKNSCSIRYRYKTKSASSFSTWTTILASDSTSDEVTTGALLSGGLSATTTYIVEVGVVDALGETGATTITVPTDKVYMHQDGERNSLTFGGYVEETNTFAIAPGINFKVKHDSGLDTVVDDTGWISLGLSSSASEREGSVGRIGKGCYYRVINGNHVYVAFCCSFSINNNTRVQINGTEIPSAYRPKNIICQPCLCDNRSIAWCSVTTYGNVVAEWVQILPSNTVTSSYDVDWVDGYIDYWI